MNEPTTETYSEADGTLNVSVRAGTLVLENTTSALVGYVAMDSTMMMAALFPPGGLNPPTLEPGSQTVLPFESITGYSAETTVASVLWWTYSPDPDGTTDPDGFVHSTDVRLR